ncbi:molybdopterin converting factor subunit 1 [Paenibacillus thiaminolyticus]|uniref:molybdopterin converting factor subunit 1 n=1 Tax=Paenibacillus thiaminolyticus TaxID=49283 RepID=UPI00232DBDAF|nr:molybdopterin converting factor subunit 1 [Paenibacillus thiaminolyticus]WCF06004.1 molybdopterin converting factor subunit 1 [Paenibacillus thiaminolyticus]
MKILLFAHLREQLGASELILDLEPLTVEELMQRLHEMYPSLALDHVMVAVNESLVDRGYPIQAADTVALLPPVSGG